MHLFKLFPIVFLAGCVSTGSFEPVNSSFNLNIKEDPTLFVASQTSILFENKKVTACQVTLKTYPVCLKYAIEQCILGDSVPKFSTIKECD